MLEREQVDRLRAENSRLRDDLDQDDDEMKHLRRRIEELESELQEVKEAATKAATRTTEWPSLPTTTQGTTAVVPSSAKPKPAISGPSLFKPAPPAKGKGREEPTPYTEAPPVGAYASGDPYADLEDDEDDDYAEYDADYRAAPTSRLGHLVANILSGKYASTATPTTGSTTAGSSLVEGRVPDLTPANVSQFAYTCDALEQAHSNGNTENAEILISAVRRFLKRCHDAPQKTDFHKRCINMWKRPGWSKTTVFDKASGTLVAGGTQDELVRHKTRMTTSKKRFVQRGQQRLLHDIATRLDLWVEGRPDPRIGSLSAPQYADHPELWRVWGKEVAKTLPRGLAVGPDGYPYERHIRGFRRIAPLFKKLNKELASLPEEEALRRKIAQIHLVGIIAVHGRYEEFLRKSGTQVNPAPSWEPIDFSLLTSNEGCARILAERGVTINEAADATHFAHDWLQAGNKIGIDTQLRVAVNSLMESVRETPEVAPWGDDVPHAYHEGHARWVPVIPVAGSSTNSIVGPAGGSTSASLTGASTSSQKTKLFVPVPPKSPFGLSPPRAATANEDISMADVSAALPYGDETTVEDSTASKTGDEENDSSSSTKNP
jgi:hypothetical protein